MKNENLCSLSASVIPKERAVAYCKLKKVFLNAKQLKCKRCLEKNCKKLETLRHPYWHQRMVMKKRGIII